MVNRGLLAEYSGVLLVQRQERTGMLVVKRQYSKGYLMIKDHDSWFEYADIFDEEYEFINGYELTALAK